MEQIVKNKLAELDKVLEDKGAEVTKRKFDKIIGRYLFGIQSVFDMQDNKTKIDIVFPDFWANLIMAYIEPIIRHESVGSGRVRSEKDGLTSGVVTHFYEDLLSTTVALSGTTATSLRKAKTILNNNDKGVTQEDEKILRDYHRLLYLLENLSYGFGEIVFASLASL